MNKTQAFKMVKEGKEVHMEMKYFERLEYVTLNPHIFSHPISKENFDFIVEMEKKNFKAYATFYGGNKSHCKFKFVTEKQ